MTAWAVSDSESATGLGLCDSEARYYVIRTPRVSDSEPEQQIAGTASRHGPETDGGVTVPGQPGAGHRIKLAHIHCRDSLFKLRRTSIGS